jgi:hypothetical protein
MGGTLCRLLLALGPMGLLIAFTLCIPIREKRKKANADLEHAKVVARQPIEKCGYQERNQINEERSRFVD